MVLESLMGMTEPRTLASSLFYKPTLRKAPCACLHAVLASASLLLCMVPTRALAQQQIAGHETTPTVARQNEVTAIDILLEPDATMLLHCAENNARLLKVSPKGFSLDATHRPHITLVQRFVRTADLDKVYAAVGSVLAGTNVTGMKLEAFKYYYFPTTEFGLAGIVVRPTPELLNLQKDVIAAVKPFTVETGTSAAFFTPDDPIIDPYSIEYVSTFVPEASGEHFNPHVITGFAPRAYLQDLEAEPFTKFKFSPAGAAVYQLGQFGTAAKKLKEWDLKR